MDIYGDALFAYQGVAKILETEPGFFIDVRKDPAMLSDDPRTRMQNIQAREGSLDIENMGFLLEEHRRKGGKDPSFLP